MNSSAIRSSVSKALKGMVAMTLSRSTDPAFDPISGGTLTVPTVQTWPIYGMLTNYNSMDRHTSQNKDGSLIQSGDMKALLEAVPGVIPLQGDKITVVGEAWQIVAVDTLKPAGVALMFKCQVRQ